MARKSRNETKIQVINIKLLSNSRSGSEAYTELFRVLYGDKIHSKVFGDKHFILRTQFQYDANGSFVLSGKLTSFSILDTRHWLDFKDMDVVEYEIPKDHFPNLKETTYYFIPDAHRFCFEPMSGFSIKKVTAFLQESLRATISSEEQIETDIEISIDAIEEIIKAKSIQKIEISISYTNQDVNEDAAEYMDRELKKMQARKIDMTILPDQHDTLSTQSKMLAGSIGLAKSNGVVKATIIDEFDRTKIIETSDYPRTINVQFEDEDQKPKSVFNKIMSIFRP